MKEAISRFVLVKLDGVRREVHCPICLGILRVQLVGTHCVSRRSLRDDPDYDALISALYPDIDKFEEQELAFNEENRNKIAVHLLKTPFVNYASLVTTNAARDILVPGKDEVLMEFRHRRAQE